MRSVLKFAAILVLILALAPIVSAKTVSKTIQVTFLPIKYIFDGVEKKPPEGQEGFVYNGTVYVPLRFVGEALGKEVHWDGKSYTVFVGAKPRTVKWLDEMEPIAVWFDDPLNQPTWYPPTVEKVKGNITANDGSRHTHGISLHMRRDGEVRVAYVLNAKYTRFEGMLVIPFEQKDEETEWVITFLGDGKELARVTLEKGDLPKPVSVDVGGVLKLEMRFSSKGKTTGSTRGLALVDARFSP